MFKHTLSLIIVALTLILQSSKTKYQRIQWYLALKGLALVYCWASRTDSAALGQRLVFTGFRSHNK